MRFRSLQRRLWPLLPPGVALFWLLAGCGSHVAEVRGQPPSGPVVPVAKVAAAHGMVTVHGRMVEK